MDWKEIRTIALVGASPKEERDSNKVMRHFQSSGFRVIPINPNYSEVNGEKCYPSLSALPEELASKIDMVDVFVRGDRAYEVARETVALKQRYGNIKVFWMQPGAYNEKAEGMCAGEGIEVISNACAMVSHSRL